MSARADYWAAKRRRDSHDDAELAADGRAALLEAGVSVPVEWDGHDRQARERALRRANAEIAVVHATGSLVPDAAKVINTCGCGRAYTEATWAALKQTGAKEYAENGVVTFEDYRNCVCGSTRMIFRVREQGKTR